MIKVNGVIFEKAAGRTLMEFLNQEGYDDNRIAVEYNGVILPKAKFLEQVLEDGDMLEIVGFVGGG